MDKSDKARLDRIVSLLREISLDVKGIKNPKRTVKSVFRDVGEVIGIVTSSAGLVTSIIALLS
jgi:hypothetical protein